MTKATQNQKPSAENVSRATSLLSSMPFLTDSQKQNFQASVAAGLEHGLLSPSSVQDLQSSEAVTLLSRLKTAHDEWTRDDLSSEMWETYQEDPQTLLQMVKDEESLIRELDEQPMTPFVQALMERLDLNENVRAK